METWAIAPATLKNQYEIFLSSDTAPRLASIHPTMWGWIARSTLNPTALLLACISPACHGCALPCTGRGFSFGCVKEP